MIALLAALSASAAGGLRIALPLLLIGLLQSDTLWARVPLLSRFSPEVTLGVLVSWSLFELFASKQLWGQRLLQLVQLILSPLVGAIMGMAIATATTTEASDIPEISIAIVGIVGGLLALVLQLVQVGWFYRLGKLPLWVILSQDGLCVALVLLAFDSPKEGGTIALLLLWLAIRSSQEWYKWYLNRPRGQHPTHKPD
ncbi:DUF4126 domain-containing protein [Oxynema sp. CENA135]|jgi:hypothetical protein|uniref:DUF4126 domain-containing protein n=1 Tax=Oxynema aestuarii AP17 TaxID=2064643 RepID=A0A6H1U0L0_9CYAN|nr:MULTISPECIES: DUF4126 domain-containing protein [Oxynema]MBK4729819.1 DUF4126 domain-containing protein [Oxynema sp. CENA135]QIZ71937.1 DUF4126 domain-containing protein [Oxynema aestuarii AP17]RMH74948.1 MAG: DUF4126 domain-containing protein [Cyanobacteria bacterium J007]